MITLPKKQVAIALFGPPGSGKSTQARILAEIFNLERFNISKLIEKIIYDPRKKNDPIIQRERALFEGGKLLTAEWLRSEVIKKRIEQVYKNLGNRGIIFSGAFRTIEDTKYLLSVLEKKYGKKNIHFIILKLSDETSIFRNSHRKICDLGDDNSYPIIYDSKERGVDECTEKGGKIKIRTLDSEETIKKRLVEYRDKTIPVFDYLRGIGFDLYEVDGEGSLEDVSGDLENIIREKIIRE